MSVVTCSVDARDSGLPSTEGGEIEMERRYALRKIAAGDYLLPSNDGRTIWRIARYEDGPSHGLDWPRDRMLWRLLRWSEPVGDDSVVDVDDLDRWREHTVGLETRAEAIDVALRSAQGGAR